MPFTDAPVPTGPISTFPKVEAQPSPSFMDVASSAIKESNVVGSLYEASQMPKPDAPAQPGFDPLASVPHGYEPEALKFLDAQSPQDVQWIKERIDAERVNQQIIARAGTLGTVTNFAAGMIDPITIASMAIPFAGEARIANMVRLAAINAGTTAAQEGVETYLNPARDTSGTLFNIGAGAVLGGILGGVVKGKVPARTLERLRGDLHTELHTPDGGEDVLGPGSPRVLDTHLPSDLPEVEPPKPVVAEGETAPEVPKQLEEQPDPFHDISVNPGTESTAGAAEVSQTTLSAESLAKGAKTMAEGPLGKPFPSLRLLTSPSVSARRLVQELASIPETLQKNVEGVKTAQPIERALWRQQGVWWQGLQARAEAFRDYRERMAGLGEEPMSRREFGEQVSGAMRRGDTHAVPEVAKAAADTRRIVIEPLHERAKAAGLIPEEAKLHADSYLLRQYNAPMIRANMGKWMRALREGFMSLHGMDPAEAADISHQVTRRILGSERGTMDQRVMEGIVPKSGRTKERTLALPDKMLEPFLNSDIDHLTQSYIHSMAPEVEMTERFGSRDLKDQIGDIHDEYARLKERELADGKDTTELDKREAADVRDVAAIRDRLYGTYGVPKDPGSFAVRAGRMLRGDNALRLLGAATLSHFPDIANVILRYGTPNTFAAIAKILSSGEALKLTSAEAKRMGAALDMTMNVTASILGDYGSHSQFLEQRLMAKATRAFTIGTGETPLITMVQALASTLAQHEILGAAQRIASGQEVSAARMTRLASSGLDADALREISKESGNFREVNGLRFGMSDKWANQKAAAAFESAILKEAHGVTLRPGVGDTPLLMSTEMGKLIFQFQTFAYASQRIVVNPLAQGLASGDARAVQGLFALLAMGTMSYASKQQAAGQPMEFSNPKRMAAEVLDKSNILGWVGHILSPALYQAGYQNLAGFQAKDAIASLAGPSISALKDVYEHRLIGKATATGDEKGLARSDLHFTRRMLAGSGPWYLRRTVDMLEDRIGDLFDLPGKSNEERREEAERKETIQ